MYGTKAGAPAGGVAATGSLAATGFNTLAMIVATLTLLAAGVSLWKLAPRLRRNR